MSIENLYSIVKTLTEINPPRSYAHSESLDMIASFISKKFIEYGYRPLEQPFPFKGQTYRNIIASIGPEDAPRIVIGAHYDVCGEQPGADDNASGVAGLLEIARLLATGGKPLQCRIDLAAYTLEEPPASFTQFMGSYVHALSLKKSGASVKGMIALEMIGYFSDEPNSQQYPPGIPAGSMPESGNFIAVVGRPLDAELADQITAGLKKTSLPTEMLLLPPQIRGVDYSDHWGFWQLGFQAVMVTDTAFYRNPNYHTASDTIDTLDFVKMAKVVQGLYWGLLG